ncbi:unnamed protein product [Orchesella dallaii]|uniref:HRDC domain-containing protein n=1 Tax=Orchesella dallaii TaxID=48710 RepID=A0ABP1RJI3_9HEXA
MPSNKAKEKSREYWKARNAFSRLDLTVLELDDEALKKRIELNSQAVFQVPDHPHRSKIPVWTLSADQLAPEILSKAKSFCLIETQKMLEFTIDHLKDQKEFAFDIELDNTYSFYDLTSFIQITTTSYNFVIDTIKLFNHVPLLADVLLDQSILKIVFGTQDVLSLQRDFGLRIFPVIDFQNVYKISNAITTEPSLKQVVKDYLDIEIQKQFQTFIWRMRPVPADALLYAQRDAEYLLEAWEVFKSKQKDFFTQNPLTYWHHRQLMLQAYTFPKGHEFRWYFNKAWEQLRSSAELIESFTLYTDMPIFKELHNWRIITGKQRNRSLNYYMSNLDVLKVAILKPKTINDLHECAQKTRELNSDTKDTVLSIISRQNNTQHKRIVEESPDPINIQLDEPEIPPAAVANDDAEVLMEVEISEAENKEESNNKDKIDVEQVYTCQTCARGQKCNLCKKQGPDNPFSVIAYDYWTDTRYNMMDYMNGKVKDRTLQNYFKKHLKRLNRVCANDHLVNQGLQPVRFKTNRGVKARLKAAQFRNTFRNTRRF